MSLKERITQDMKDAMRAGEKERLGYIRMLQAAIKQREVDERIMLDDTQVLAVTHLAQVAACADGHFLVSKSSAAGRTLTDVQPVAGEARVSEIARMLGGERLAGTSRAHAQALLGASR